MNLNYKFKTIVNKLLPSGRLVYEYNPLRNYRYDEIKYIVNGELILSPVELCKRYNWDIIKEDPTENKPCYYDTRDKKFKSAKFEEGNKKTITELKVFHDITDNITVIYPGEIHDFITDKLKVNISNPVDIIPQYSYDNSVDLIINDGINIPKIVNSRFSAVEKNTYKIVDRNGNNDTNIYDDGNFVNDVSLYKFSKYIPKVTYLGTYDNGNLSVGKYNFYFKYQDADGNETDFIYESGLVSVFIGNEPSSIHSGMRDQNSYKSIRFKISNIDPAYSKLTVYYTRSTGDGTLNALTNAYKFIQPYNLRKNNDVILITGFEEKIEIPISDINLQYLLYDNVQTHAICQNRLFLGNCKKTQLNYDDLKDISLRFLPFFDSEPYLGVNINEKYRLESQHLSNSYYDSKYIYNSTGYWDQEIYRFGIVYIFNNGELSDVYNIRGIDEIPLYDKNVTLEIEDVYESNNAYYNKRNYIPCTEDYRIVSNKIVTNYNTKGVFRVKANARQTDIISFKFVTNLDVITYLKEQLHVIGFFFVRQKRIPTTLCQAYMIETEKNSHVPVIPFKNSGNLTEHIVEKIIDDNFYLTNDYTPRLHKLELKYLQSSSAICPDYDVNFPYYNNLFTGGDFLLQKIAKIDLYRDGDNERHYYTKMSDVDSASGIKQDLLLKAKIIGLEDSSPLHAIDDYKFLTRAGNAEEAFRFKFLEKDILEGELKEDWNNSKFGSFKKYSTKNFFRFIANKQGGLKKYSRLVRGAYGPILGIKANYDNANTYFNIKIPDYNELNMADYFKMRYEDTSPYYAVSDRININDNQQIFDIYRGDCYICQFTHRLNRNFLDSTAKSNDEIVDEESIYKIFKDEGDSVFDDVSKLEKINRGDVNAVKLGSWITLQVRSTFNLNIRSLDESYVDEKAYFGHPRGFYPYQPMDAAGEFKIHEALCYNKGFEKSMSEKVYFGLPDAPAYNTDFTNRIAYSEMQIRNAFQNSYRVFRDQCYRDYPKTYGSIVKLIELGGNLLCVFEHGVGLIPVNERTVAGTGSGGDVFINTANVLPENPKILSDTYGSLWKESIIKTPAGVYGVDATAKKIWFTDGNGFRNISDFRVQEFLNQHITLTERELTPIIGIRNIKTHYNKYKNDVMFTFYDNLEGQEEKAWNLCWNETLQKWITFYSWIPIESQNIQNLFYSFDRDTSKYISKLGISKNTSQFAHGITLTNVLLNNMDDPKSTNFVNDYTVEIPYTTKSGLRRVLKWDISSDAKATENFIGFLLFKNIISEDLLELYDIDYNVDYDYEQNYKMFEIKKIETGEGLYYGIAEDESTENNRPVDKLELPYNAANAGSPISLYGLYFKLPNNENDIESSVYIKNGELITDDNHAVYYKKNDEKKKVRIKKTINRPETIMSELFYRNSVGISYADVDEHKLAPGLQTVIVKDSKDLVGLYDDIIIGNTVYASPIRLFEQGIETVPEGYGNDSIPNSIEVACTKFFDLLKDAYTDSVFKGTDRYNETLKDVQIGNSGLMEIIHEAVNNSDITKDKFIPRSTPYKCTNLYELLNLNGLIKPCTEINDTTFNLKRKYTMHGIPLYWHWVWIENGENKYRTVYTDLPPFKDVNGKRVRLPENLQINPDKLIRNINVTATVKIKDSKNIEKLYRSKYNSNDNLVNQTSVFDVGKFSQTIAVTPKWNLQFLSSDFWKHGKAGIIDLQDDIYPTMWYGKLHPFEFEVIVVNDPSVHKIFNNLELVSNKAKPESFHYEIIGDSYDFANDKPNMYFRQEAMKALWQYNGANITYDKNFVKTYLKQQNKSADLPKIYYSRQDKLNTVEDYYKGIENTNNKNYDHLGGAEITYYPSRNEYRIWNHAKAIDIDDLKDTHGAFGLQARSLIQGNMRYLEDRWKIVINPIIICYKNEYSKTNNPDYLFDKSNSTWIMHNNNSRYPRLPIYNSPIPDEVIKNAMKNEGKINFPPILSNIGYSEYDIDKTNWLKNTAIYAYNFGADSNRKEIDVKDKFLKIRIRYSGEDLAVIDFLNTVYRISYS